MSNSNSYGKIKYINNIWLIDARPDTETMFKMVFSNWLYIHPVTNKTYTQTGIYSYVPYREIQDYKFGVRHSAAACKDLLWFMQRYPLDITPEELEKMKTCQDELIRQQDRVRLIFNESFSGPKLELALPLRKYQEQAVGMFFEVNNMLLGDSVGLGKAQPLDAKILTPNGFKPMGDVYVGG